MLQYGRSTAQPTWKAVRSIVGILPVARLWCVVWHGTGGGCTAGNIKYDARSEQMQQTAAKGFTDTGFGVRCPFLKVLLSITAVVSRLLYLSEMRCVSRSVLRLLQTKPNHNVSHVQYVLLY